MTCPNCNSERIRRGGHITWAIYLALIAGAIAAVVVLQLHAGIVAGIALAVILLTHIILGERVCLDCGTQWRGTPSEES